MFKSLPTFNMSITSIYRSFSFLYLLHIVHKQSNIWTAFSYALIRMQFPFVLFQNCNDLIYYYFPQFRIIVKNEKWRLQATSPCCETSFFAAITLSFKSLGAVRLFFFKGKYFYSARMHQKWQTCYKHFYFK